MKAFAVVFALWIGLGVTNSSWGQQCRQCGETAGDRFHYCYHANAQWPKYYILPARCAVNSAYTAMIANGWRRQNLLGGYHFEKDTNQLTRAGQLKAHWILTQAPQDRRNIFVERGDTQSDTEARIASVQTWASEMSPAIEQVMVNDTHIVSEGHPAGAVDNVFVGFQTNQPAPVLPAATGSGGSSSSGGD